ncbi:MAG: hypothetical protein Q7J06_09125, partial [Bacteroidales bacterium]|nr:hypothetical protein [Bacteroidales bacterium]
NSPETQKDLGIEHKFTEIYQEEKDISKLNEYKLKFFQYGISVLADKKLGNPQDPKTLEKKIVLLHEVSIDPKNPVQFIENYSMQGFDSKGNLNPSIVKELIYCAQPVQRALDEFAKQGILYESNGRSKIDSAFLKGFWTPIGFVDNARLKAQEK